MKQVRVTFTDEEHNLVLNAKDKQTWHDFILNVATAINNTQKKPVPIMQNMICDSESVF